MKNKIIIAIACLATMGMYAQKVQVAKADKNYEKFAYIDAIKTYERVFEKGYKTPDMLQKLGNAYYFNADLEQAAKWYGELFALTQDVEPEYYYRYAQSLKAMKDYKKADQMMATFHQKKAEDLRGKLSDEQKDYLNVIRKNSGRYTLENTGINSEKSDYGSAYFGNKVIFTSARDTSGAKKHAWTGESFTALYEADMGEGGSLADPKKFATDLNSKYHESTPVFTKDGKTVYFTRNNFLNGKKGKDDDRITLLKIYKATLEGNKWTNITALPFNSDDYSVAHPALSKDEKTLYFASNMPGTTGHPGGKLKTGVAVPSDIWKVDINSDGTFGTPVNLGAPINTEARETFPFVAGNELYFASDGHPGLGGLDIYMSKILANGTYDTAINAGEPINSSKDDFAFIINPATRSGYISSNRDGGQGSDDIYRFQENIPIVCEQLLTGVVTDKETGAIIANAKVTLMDSNFNMIREFITDSEGKFDFGKVSCDTKYYLRGERPEYTTVEVSTITGKETGKTFVPIELEKSTCQVKVGDDLRKCFKIQIIYFDLDKSNIRPDAAIDLAKILDVLQQNPTMEIAIRSHTDCRQTAKYNMALSDRRAKSTMAWLVKNGIDKKRLRAQGFGESELLNNCPCEPTNESSCSEAEHQLNRRSEFIITKL